MAQIARKLGSEAEDCKLQFGAFFITDNPAINSHVL